MHDMNHVPNKLSVGLCTVTLYVQFYWFISVILFFCNLLFVFETRAHFVSLAGLKPAFHVAGFELAALLLPLHAPGL